MAPIPARVTFTVENMIMDEDQEQLAQDIAARLAEFYDEQTTAMVMASLGENISGVAADLQTDADMAEDEEDA